MIYFLTCLKLSKIHDLKYLKFRIFEPEIYS